MTLEELRRLMSGVEPLPFHEAPPGYDPEVVAFNGAVSKFRELVVRARNLIVRGRDVPQEMRFELQALAKALPEERVRTGRQGGPDLPG